MEFLRIRVNIRLPIRDLMSVHCELKLIDLGESLTDGSDSRVKSGIFSSQSFDHRVTRVATREVVWLHQKRRGGGAFLDNLWRSNEAAADRTHCAYPKTVLNHDRRSRWCAWEEIAERHRRLDLQTRWFLALRRRGCRSAYPGRKLKSILRESSR